MASHSVYENRRYPSNIGFLWMSGQKSYSGLLYVEHNSPKGCLPWEQDRTAEVWTNIKNSTWGQSSMSAPLADAGKIREKNHAGGHRTIDLDESESLIAKCPE